MDIERSSISRLAGMLGNRIRLFLAISLLFSGFYCDKNPINSEDETVTDIDGNVYQTIQIGSQLWTVENLRTTRYNDGSAIPLVTDSAIWYGCETPAYCHYRNTTNADSIKKYGSLYNWYTIKTGKLAPLGWHIPTDAEWDTLQNYLIANGYNWDGTTSGNKIAKALAAKISWRSCDTTGTIGCDLTKNNRSRFSALPGGYRYNIDNFKYKTFYGFWWSCTEDDATCAFYRLLHSGSDSLCRYSFAKRCGFSVRLLKDLKDDTEAVASDKSALVIIFSAGDSAGSVTNDVGLSTSGVNATNISWATSDSSRVTTSGVVNRPDSVCGDAQVTLTAKIWKGITSDQKVFNLTVKLKVPVTDIDGNVYTTIKIGKQVWTVENLRTTRYNDGSAIPLVTDNAEWAGVTTPSYCYYNNTTNADSIKKFGALYNWYVVSPTNPKKIAPVGCHVPDNAEWTILENYLATNGYNWDGTTSGNKIAKALASKTDWNLTTFLPGAIGNDLTKNNRSGFSALPGGCRYDYGAFSGLNQDAFWWSVTEYDSSNAYNRYLYSIYEDLGKDFDDKGCGFSVRLLQDSD